MGAWTQFHQTWPGYRAIVGAGEICLLRYLAAFSNAVVSKLIDVESEKVKVKISHFLTSPSVSSVL